MTGRRGGAFTLTRPGPARANGDSRVARAPVPRQWRRSMLALGVTLAGLGVLAGGFVFTSFAHQRQVLEVTADVAAGQRITAADLTPASISAGSGLRVIPAGQQSQVVGLVAAVGLRAGTLLVPADLTSVTVPGPGQQLVPVALHTDQLPASGLTSGQEVLVTPVPGANGSQGSAQPALSGPLPARVYQVGAADQDGNVVVDLIVAKGQGPKVAAQASTGQVALVITPGTGSP